MGGSLSTRVRVASHLLASAMLFLALAGSLHAATWQGDVTRHALAMFPKAGRVGPITGTPPAAPVMGDDGLLGYVLATDQVTPIPAYSGKPISVLVGVDVKGVIRGATILHHEEPILVLGISDQRLKAFTSQYSGHRATSNFKIGGAPAGDTVTLDGISGATITMMVLNSSILRSVRAVAKARALPLSPEALAQISASTEAMRAAADKREDAASPGPAVSAVPDESEPLWKAVWQQRIPRLVVLAAGLLTLTVILFIQDWLTRHRLAVAVIRVAFLVYTLLFIGAFGPAQLSVVNVLTFVHAAIRDFNWETFLIEPMIFALWSFVAVSLILWGRGVYCGWLCPFGAAQELISKLALALRVPQFPFHPLIHERLLAIKYVALLALFGLSLQSLPEAVRYAEVEPFKTVFTLRMDRAWPFVTYAVALLALSAFNGKFFCKYLCPLGAALTIPSHFRIFDWLRRRKECGRPCQSCAARCPSQAIRPTGEINANECHYCLDCQVLFWDSHVCPPLVERRKRAEKRGRTLQRIPL